MKLSKFILPLFFLLALSQCKKEHRYSDDPDKSKKTPKERLEGAWRIETYTFKSNNIIDTLNMICACILTESVQLGYSYIKEEHRWEFSISGFGTSGYRSNNAFDDYSYLQLGPSDPFITTKTFDKLFVTPFRSEQGAVARWEVTKLFGDELSIQLKTDTGMYKIEFIKINV